MTNKLFGNDVRAGTISDMNNTNQRVALITGGNRGLGLQTARELGRQGIRVILGARDASQAAAAARALHTENIEADPLRLDVTDSRAHEEAYEILEARFGRLDILVNNAGIWRESATSSDYVRGSNRTSSISMEVLREIFETNFFGTVALTNRLLPLIRKSAAGRIVNAS